jgi:uncharacterized membrane protein YhaH (DUF805 family)
MDPQAVIEVFRRNLTQHYFDVKGRVRRQEFWYFVLAAVVVSIVASIIDAVLSTGLLRPLVGLALLLPMTGLGIRRLQDTGRNGKLVWVFAGLYALMLVLTLIVVFTYTATVVSPYGYNPYAATAGVMMFGGLMSLVGVATLVVGLVLLYFWVQPGTVGPNQYGPDPKAPAEQVTA